MKHTQEPWVVNFKKFSEVRTENGAVIAKCNNLTGLVNLQANARRIVACVNACEGLSKDALDGGWSFKGISEYTKQIERQRDDLLTALELVVTEALNDEEGAPGTLAIADAIEVIEKVNGSAFAFTSSKREKW